MSGDLNNPASNQPQAEDSPGRGTSKKRPILLSLLGFALVLAMTLAGALWYASTPEFETIVRNRLVDTLERATGGRVELGAFRWRLWGLEFEADNLTIHGLEAAKEIPYAHIDRLFVRAKIISFLEPKVGLNILEGKNPVFHLIVYPDGSTNQPRPKKVTEHGSVTDTLFDLAVDRTEITHGLLLINQRAVPFDFAANNLGVSVSYDAARDHYLADLDAADITAQRGKQAVVHSQVTLRADLARNNAVLSQFRLQTGESPKERLTLEASGSLTNYADPQIQVAAKGSVDIREVESLTAVPGLESGIVDLQIEGKGNPSRFTLDGQSKVTGASYRLPQLRVGGVTASANIHITQDELSLTSLKATLRDGGGLDGELHLVDWLAPTPATPTRQAAVAAVAKKTQNLPTPSPALVAKGSICAQIRGVTLRSILNIAAPEGFDDLGFETVASGPVSMEWTGNADDLRASANVALVAGDARYGVPLSGAVDATYDNRRGVIELRKLVAQTPGSHAQAEGSLGVSPPNRASLIQTDLITTNLAEFDKTLRALGVSATGPSGRRTRVEAIPVQLHGQAEFHGTVIGNLKDPDVKGHLSATNFDTVFAREKRPEVSAGEAIEAAANVATPQAAAATPTQTLTDIHWDSLDAQAEYSLEMISVQQATLLRNKTTIHASGQLHAHETSRGRRAFDDDSVIQATVAVQKEDIGDLLAIEGSTAPVSGSVNLQAHVGGTLGNLNGGGHLEVQGGQIYGEAYRSLNSDLRFSGHEVDATNLKFLQDGGQITGDGGYDLRAKTVHFQAKGSGFELAHFQQLQTPHVQLAGDLGFQASGSGPVRNPSVQTTLHIAKLVVNNQFKGSLDANAHLDHQILTYQVDSGLDAALLALTGQTMLTGDYHTEARLTARQLHLGRLVRMSNIKDFVSDSILTVQASVTGPARYPKRMEGTLDADRFAVSISGIALQNNVPLHAVLHDGTVHFDTLKITGEDTDLQAQGSVALIGTARALNLHARGAVNLKLAQSFDPNIASSGHVDFSVDALGTVERPNLVGQVKFTNVAVSLGDLPNGLSQMNGTLVFDQDRLTVQQLTAVTGGGKLQLGGFITYQQGLYGDLTATGKDIRIRYPQGVSSMADAKLRLQGTEASLLLSGTVVVTRFATTPSLDLASLKSSVGTPGPMPDANSPSNHVRLDVHITSAPELNFQNSFAKLAGDVDLRVRGTVANPSLLGHINILDGSANFAGTTYQLQRGDISFSNPIHIDPVIDLEATTRVEDYDVEISLQGTLSKLNLTYRSEPPLPEADVFSLLALGRTQEEQQIYSTEQQQAGVNSTADALLGGALNATVSNRVQKLFGVGSVKVDPTFVSNLGDSTARITIEERIGKNFTLTYATNVNSTAQQLIAGQLYVTPNVSIVAQRDEYGVFSMILKIHQRRR